MGAESTGQHTTIAEQKLRHQTQESSTRAHKLHAVFFPQCNAGARLISWRRVEVPISINQKYTSTDAAYSHVLTRPAHSATHSAKRASSEAATSGTKTKQNVCATAARACPWGRDPSRVCVSVVHENSEDFSSAHRSRIQGEEFAFFDGPLRESDSVYGKGEPNGSPTKKQQC